MIITTIITMNIAIAVITMVVMDKRYKDTGQTKRPGHGYVAVPL